MGKKAGPRTSKQNVSEDVFGHNTPEAPQIHRHGQGSEIEDSFGGAVPACGEVRFGQVAQLLFALAFAQVSELKDSCAALDFAHENVLRFHVRVCVSVGTRHERSRGQKYDQFAHDK